MTCDLCGKKIEANEACSCEDVVESKLCRACFAMVNAENVQKQEEPETKCSECGKPLQSFYQLQEDKLCDVCHGMRKNLAPPVVSTQIEANSDINNKLSPASDLPLHELKPEDTVSDPSEVSKPDAVQKVVAFLFAIVATIYGSFYFSAYAVTATISGGHPSAWGFEYMLCFFAPIPGVIGFAIAYLSFLREMNAFSRCTFSAICGVATAFLAMTVFGLVVTAPQRNEKNRITRKADSELSFFKAALEGGVKDSDIIAHYKTNTLSDFDRSRIRSALFESTYQYSKSRFLNITAIQPKSITLLIDAFAQDPEIVGRLVSLPKAPLESKIRVAETTEPAAIKYLASDPKTPSDILLKYATHPSDDISQLVSKNKNSPLEARWIYTIRTSTAKNLFDRQNELVPPGFDSKEEKDFWYNLAKDRREYVRTWVAKSMITPGKILDKLSSDSNTQVLQWIVLNNVTPQQVRRKAAGKLATTVNDFLKTSSNDKDSEVRMAVALNRETPLDILKEMCSDKDEYVRMTLVRNSHISRELLEVLSHDRSRSVQIYAEDNMKFH